MKLNDNEIRVFYRFDSKINEILDLALIDFFEKQGFEYSASGSNFLNQTRELVFEKMGE